MFSLLLLLLVAGPGAMAAAVPEAAAEATAEAAAEAAPVSEFADIRFDGADINVSEDALSKDFDVVLVIVDALSSLTAKNAAGIKAAIEEAITVDPAFGSSSPDLLISDVVPSKRIVYAPVDVRDGDVTDAHNYEIAGAAAGRRAVQAGAKRPILVCQAPPGRSGYISACMFAAFGVLQETYVPLSVRGNGSPSLLESVTLYADGSYPVELFTTGARIAAAVESGKIVARDICGADPERMNPAQAADYIRQAFNNSGAKLTAYSPDQMEQAMPLTRAAIRASSSVDRFAPQGVQLGFDGPGVINRTLLLMGSGITYDYFDGPGGSRQKCGAATVVGIVKALTLLKPEGLRVISGTPFIRTSVGADNFAADDIAVSGAGRRVRLGSAAGVDRLLMADAANGVKMVAAQSPNPYVFAISTLTDHARLAHGYGYPVVVENAASRALGVGANLELIGDRGGSPVEVSRLRKEDFAANLASNDPEADLVAYPGPSTSVNRGHQQPVAFILQAAGLDNGSSIPFTHIDITGPATTFPGVPATTPLTSITYKFGLSAQLQMLMGIYIPPPQSTEPAAAEPAAEE
ncbi:probable cytosol aminopeptidase [Aplysia californica]|uniref:Probable cytosol aminopeptidase n=1 Tax=Aplysia californica TaxID=6500 RepID=A0ABM1ADA9_APLCA|nr:probable cytosol aminopeptidase [Aplysia californica]